MGRHLAKLLGERDAFFAALDRIARNPCICFWRTPDPCASCIAKETLARGWGNKKAPTLPDIGAGTTLQPPQESVG